MAMIFVGGSQERSDATKIFLSFRFFQGGPAFLLKILANLNPNANKSKKMGGDFLDKQDLYGGILCNDESQLQKK